MNETRLNMESAADAQGAVLRLAGEIDLHSSPGLRTTLIEVVEGKPGRIILDLGGVSYIDSSGVGTIVEFKRRLERGGGRVVLAAPQPRVRSVFEITRLDRFFTIANSVDEARAL